LNQLRAVRFLLFLANIFILNCGVFVTPKTMRAVVYRGANDLRLELLPVPHIRSNELLVKVAVCGVCPTDIKKIKYGTVAPPRVFGHETAGTIVRTGSLVRGFKVGDRVALHHHVPCLECHACRHKAFAQCPQYKRTGITAGFEPAGGGYAQYVRVMPFVLPGVVKIPARNSLLQGAMLEPVNTVLKAVKRLRLLPGDTVLVAGQGPIGLMFTRLLALRGMVVLATDLLPTRLALAAEFGARKVFAVQSAPPSQADLAHPSSSEPQPAGPTRNGNNELAAVVDRMTHGRGLDAAVIAVPSAEVVRQAQDLVRGAGQVLLFSHTKRGESAELDLATVCVDEKDLIGSYSADVTLQAEVARLIFTRKLDVARLITHEFPLDQTAAAVDLAAHPTPDSLKILVTHDLVAKASAISLSSER
jgi:L-iditol 2-dehydrogenase